MDHSTQFEAEFRRQVDLNLDAVFDRVKLVNADVKKWGDPRLLADQVTSAIPYIDPNNIDAGPFYTTSSLTKWLKVTRQYVFELTRQRRIISLTTNEGHRIYPAFQFGTKGSLIPDLPAVVRELDFYVEPATLALWFVTPQLMLGGMTPIEWLHAGKDHMQVVRTARMYVHRLTNTDKSLG